MMQVERSSVRFGTIPIPYGIRRSTRRATVTIAVDPNEGVLVMAPASASVERLDRIVHRKARWIVGQLRSLPSRPALGREFVNGETFIYLGRQYRLRVVRGQEPAFFSNGRLVVPIDATEPDRPTAVRAAVVSWYRAHAQARIPERVEAWSRKLRIETPTVQIREPRKRWGSCDVRGHLRFNWRVIQAPRRLVDYVVVHELVHLEHRAHSKKFWTALQRAMPDFESRREALRVLGPRFIW